MTGKTIFITGGTGFVGRALILRLLRDGHSVVATSRDPERGARRLGPDVRVVPSYATTETLHAAAQADAVIHLAGEPIAGRWTAAKKARIRASRVDGTRRLLELLRAAGARPGVFLSASAIGWYGDRDVEVTEAESKGQGFLAAVCAEWEGEVVAAEALGSRVAMLRLGVVLGREGGAAAKLLPLGRLGLSGRLGSGDQPVSWVHLHDAVELFVAALDDDRFEGPFNAVAGHLPQRDLARAVARAAGRSFGLPAPAIAVRLALGEAAEMLLGGAPVRSTRLERLGHKFTYPTVDRALGQIVDPAHEPRVTPATGTPEGVPGQARFLLEQHTRIEAPLEDTFEFFSRAHNLALLTPTWTDFRVLAETDLRTEEGTRISYRLSLGPIPLSWRTVIARWEPGRGFVDMQERGPYSLWWHEHEFRERDGGVDMIDRVHYTPPLGVLGRLANRLFVAPTLKRIFAWRAEAIGLRFGPSSGAATGSV